MIYSEGSAAELFRVKRQARLPRPRIARHTEAEVRTAGIPILDRDYTLVVLHPQKWFT